MREEGLKETVSSLLSPKVNETDLDAFPTAQ